MPRLSHYTSVFRVQRSNEQPASNSNSNSNSNSFAGQASADADASQTQSHGAALNSAGRPARRSQPRAKSRPVVSCLLCRSRKLKCDRLLPCGTCSRRGDGALCRYGNEGGVSSVSQRAVAAAAGGPAHDVRYEAQMRLKKLEEMVNRMMATSGPLEAPTESPTEASTEVSAESASVQAAEEGGAALGDPEPGDMTADWSTTSTSTSTSTSTRTDSLGEPQQSSAGQVASMIGEAPFVGATNWAAVLDSIRDIHSYLGEAGRAGSGTDEHVENGDGDERDDGDAGAADAADDDGMDETDNGLEETEARQTQRSAPSCASYNLPPSYVAAMSPAPTPEATSAARGGGGSLRASASDASTPRSARDSAAAPSLSLSLSLLETAEADGIFAAAATAAPGLADPARATMARGTPPRMPKQMAEAVSCLPPRRVCDRLLTVYFQSSYMTGPYVHMGAFQRAYSRFWRTGNPASAHAASPLLWISMLASVLNIGAIISGGRRRQQQQSWAMADSAEGGAGTGAGAGAGCGHATPTPGNGTSSREASAEPSNEDLVLAGRLRKLSTACLLAGDYLSGRALSVEALLLNAQVRVMLKRDHDATLWATFGVVVRLAQRMGYQQVDAPAGGSYGVGGRLLTPFEKEMRRRTWYIIEALDMLCSFQYGMPTMIHEDETCTGPPSNLRDDDFDEDSTTLPPSRAASDYTPAVYFSYKLSFVRLLRRVLRLVVWQSGKPQKKKKKTTSSSSSSSSSSDDGLAHKAAVADLADELTRTYAGVPVRLRMPTHIQDCPFSDTCHDIMNRLGIELLNHKATCILFRGSLSRRDTSGGGGVDACGYTAAETRAQRQACLVSALRILDLHTEFDYETRPASASAAASATTGGSRGDYFEGGGPDGGGPAARGAGRLANDRHMVNTLAVHDFLLAATILCLDLIEKGRSNRGNGASPDSGAVAGAGAAAGAGAGAGAATATNSAAACSRSLAYGGEPTLEERAASRGAKLDALRRAYALWHEQRFASRDAAHAARILGAIVTKLSSEGGGGGGGGGAAGGGLLDGSRSVSYMTTLSDDASDWGITAQLAYREQIAQETSQRARARRADKAGQAEHAASAAASVAGSSGGSSRTGPSAPEPDHATTKDATAQSTQNISNMPIPSAVYEQHRAQQPTQPTQPTQQMPLLAVSQSPPPHLNHAYDWSEPGPFGAAIDDPMSVDWNMVDALLLDRQPDTEVGGNVWSADLMALES